MITVVRGFFLYIALIYVYNVHFHVSCFSMHVLKTHLQIRIHGYLRKVLRRFLHAQRMSSSNAKNSRSDQLEGGVPWRVAQLVLSWPCLRKTMTMMMLGCGLRMVGPCDGQASDKPVQLFFSWGVTREVRKFFQYEECKNGEQQIFLPAIDRTTNLTKDWCHCHCGNLKLVRFSYFREVVFGKNLIFTTIRFSGNG